MGSGAVKMEGQQFPRALHLRTMLLLLLTLTATVAFPMILSRNKTPPPPPVEPPPPPPISWKGFAELEGLRVGLARRWVGMKEKIVSRIKKPPSPPEEEPPSASTSWSALSLTPRLTKRYAELEGGLWGEVERRWVAMREKIPYHTEADEFLGGLSMAARTVLTIVIIILSLLPAPIAFLAHFLYLRRPSTGKINYLKT